MTLSKQELVDVINDLYAKMKYFPKFSIEWLAIKREKDKLMREYYDRYPETSNLH